MADGRIHELKFHGSFIRFLALASRDQSAVSS